ncbi:GNAT family N-acetyltransferase/peptidase C39 family protein [Zavarzinia sp. CC-PAN008]|uniref:GNAT family N-acetyltransferase/peptidase C39 family protein n=1 Tax=Zavarzinia sp. CC-PAN008 TaxID=3243332 RepID=UPI003F742D6C
MSQTTIRPACLDDLDPLLALEAESFDGDRITERAFRHLLTKGNAATLVATADEKPGLQGYLTLLFHGGSALARVYSIAVSREARGSGVSAALLTAAEQAAIARGCAAIRLETRIDNHRAQKVFAAAGYRAFGRYPDYYEDHADAVRMEKILLPAVANPVDVPYWRQSFDFTCGPACLMMAMKACDPALPLDLSLELRLWREATTIFMTSGHGGCGPHGLALAAWRRGFDAEIFVNGTETLFIDSVRSPERKQAIQLVQREFEAEIAATGIASHQGALDLGTLKSRLAAGSVPLVLISLYRLTRDREPHWVAVTGADERFVTINDPWIGTTGAPQEAAISAIDIPISVEEFARMARFGRGQQKAAVVISPRPTPQSGARATR